MALRDAIIQFSNEHGLVGLIILAFTDAFISPVIPDIVLIPLSLTNPDKAIFYFSSTIVASITGSLVGYFIGNKVGKNTVTRFVPERYWTWITGFVDKYGGWAIFWGAMAPIPYKYIAVSAGVLGVERKTFLFFTALGRAVRFLLEGILIYYFGNSLIDAWHQISLFFDQS